MQNSLSRIKELWINTSRVNQVMIVALALASVLVGVGFIIWAGTPNYVTLVSGSSPSDSSRIVELLKEKSIPYRISQDGNSIEVPSSQRAELRMTLAGAGLMNSGSQGYGLLDKGSISETADMQKERIRRALEGELENSVQSLDPVSSANVKIAPGDDSPFVNPEKKEASASILVHLKPGRELSKENVRAIISLVKCAYAGLSEKSIALADGEGNLLWDGKQDASETIGLDDRQAEEHRFKEGLAKEIQAQIQRVVGPGKSSVLVRAVMDFDSQTEESHTVTPGARESRSSIEEKLTGGSMNNPKQPAGMAANTGAQVTPPTYGTPGNVNANSGNYTSTQTEEKLNNGINDKHIVKAPGTVKTLAVAVMLDKSVPADTVTAVRQEIQTIVSPYSVDQNSQPQVTVQAVTFDKTSEDAEKKAADASASAERMNRWISYSVPIVLMMFMLFILTRSLRRPSTQRQTLALAGAGADGGQRAIGPGGGQSLDLLVGEDSSKGAPSLGTIHPDPTPVEIPGNNKTHTFEVIPEAFDANLESIAYLAKTKPATVALLIKSWLSEEERRR